MKVLLSAYSCEPGRGSEPGVGWNWALQIARFHDVWVLTHREGREAIKAALANGARSRIQFIYLDLPPWALFWMKWPWGWEVHYYLWQLAAYFVGRRLHREIGFDFVHHATLVKYWMPSFLALLPVPFIWGPVGGGESAPPAFRRSFKLRGKIFELARDLARTIGECDPFVRLTARRAARGFATTEETAKRMRMLGCSRVSVLSQVGLPQQEIRRLSSVAPCHSTPFRLVSVGQLIHLKAFDLSVRAFAAFHRQYPESEYWIIGNGPERKGLERLARQFGVEERVRFLGWLRRPEVLRSLAECDVLIHPTLHDSGGWVCLEAMAAGRPVVCLDLGGPALQVTDETGIKVPAISPDQAVNALATAVARLADDAMLRARMGRASQLRVEESFDWDRKGELLAQVYADIVREGGLAAC